MLMLFIVLIMVVSFIQVRFTYKIFEKKKVEQIKKEVKKELAEQTFAITKKLIEHDEIKDKVTQDEALESVKDHASEIYEEYECRIADKMRKNKYQHHAYAYVFLRQRF